MIFNVDHLAKECAATLASLPEYPEVEQGSLRLSKSVGQAGRTERWYNPKIGRFLYTKNPMPIEYPSLEQGYGNSWITWMSGAPDECLSMKSLARGASGHSLISGLGLGILAWMCAANPLVKSVTVVEIQQGVIDIVGPVVSHPKITILQGDVNEYLRKTTERYDFIGLDTWPDAGSAVMESSDAKAFARRALTRNGLVRTWLDEIADRLNQSNALAKALRQAQKTQGRMLDEPQMIGNRACDFCGSNPFIDCYGFCFECFSSIGICGAAGVAIREKANRLLARMRSGELIHLAEPYPEMYEYLLSQHPRQ